MDDDEDWDLDFKDTPSVPLSMSVISNSGLKSASNTSGPKLITLDAMNNGNLINDEQTIAHKINNKNKGGPKLFTLDNMSELAAISSAASLDTLHSKFNSIQHAAVDLDSLVIDDDEPVAMIKLNNVKDNTGSIGSPTERGAVSYPISYTISTPQLYTCVESNAVVTK